MTIQHWRIFVTVCECNSITAAANKLFMAQPSVSRSIIELEQYYNIKLFDRVNKRLRITPTGQTILGYARDLIAQYDQMENAIRGLDAHDSIRIGASLTFSIYFMADCLKEFKMMYPEMSINLVVELSSVLIQKVIAGELDIAFVERTPDTIDLQVKPIPGDQVFFFCKKGTPISRQDSVSIQNLQQCRLCLKVKGHASRDIFDATLLATHGIVFPPAVESINADVLASHVIHSDNLIGALPYWQLKDYLDTDQISIIRVDNLEISRDYYMVSRKNRKFSLKEQKFIGICEAVFRTRHNQMISSLRGIR